MTTGSNFNMDYINVKPDDDTRCIVDLLKEEERNGYSGMSDGEIAHLIAYKEAQAVKSEVVESIKATHQQEMETFHNLITAQLQQVTAINEALYKATGVFATVDGSEVE